MIAKKQNMEMGIIISLILLVLSLVLSRGQMVVPVIILLFVSILLPVLYTPITWVWFKFAHLLEVTFSYFILGLVFFILLTPVAFIRYLFTKNDILQLRKFKKSRQSVFHQRNHIYQPSDLDNQF